MGRRSWRFWQPLFRRSSGSSKDVTSGSSEEMRPLSFGLSEEQGLRESQEDRSTILQDMKVDGINEQIAFVGVYDGHGGSEASQFVKERLHIELAAALSARADEVTCNDITKMDAAVQAAIYQAFERTDQQFLIESTLKTCGSCAVCALFIGRRRLYLANLGDSRAVLAGKNRTLVTADHKPSRPDESERIRRGGGVVLYRRVNGELAVSRAFGDAHLKMLNPCMLPPDAFAKNVEGGFDVRPDDLPAEGLSASEEGENVYTEPLVLSQPEVTSIELSNNDEYLLMACDGVWDVMTNEEVVEFTRQRLRDAGSREGNASGLAARNAFGAAAGVSAEGVGAAGLDREVAVGKRSKLEKDEQPLDEFAVRVCHAITGKAMKQHTTDNVTVALVLLC